MTRLLAAVICLLLLCSCGYFPSGGTQELLVAPRLNKRQAALDAALRQTLSLQQIVYKYPQTGDFRSPFVFQDLNNDGKEEAIVFYAYADAPGNIRFKVLSERDDASWYAIHDSPSNGDGDQISFIQFANILDTQCKCMVIGWQSTSRSQSQLGVYSYRDDGFQKEALHPYLLWDMRDYDKDGLNEVTVISQAVNELTGLGSIYQMSLLAKGLGGSVSELDTTLLPLDTVSVLQLLYGTLPDSSPAVYLDVQLPGEGMAAQVATAVVGIDGDKLTPVVGDSNLGLFTDTVRDYQDQPALCTDWEEDGIIEVPVLHPLVGAPDSQDLGELMLTDYLHLEEEGFVTAYTAAVNYNDGYLVRFPEQWLDGVTVVRVPEIREWQFVTYDSREDRIGVDLLKIQALSAQENQYQFTDYALLGQKGQIRYYAYIPTPRENDPLAVTLKEVETMFRPL